MKKLFKILGAILIFFLLVQPVKAENIADSSANILKVQVKKFDNIRFAKKKIAISKVFKRYNSPLINSIDSFLFTCETYELDCYLLPSIAGLESSFGNHVLSGSNNPFGWGGGYIMFDTWEEGFMAVAKGLSKNYIARGADTIETMGPIYAASPTWAQRVRYFHNEFERVEVEKKGFFKKLALASQ